MLFNVYLWTKVPRKRVLGAVRVLAYGLVVSAGLGALTVRNAVADVEDQSLALGRKLADLSDLLQTGNELRLNGQTVYFATATSDESVNTVLDRFEAHCNRSRAFDAVEWKSLGNVKGDTTPPGMSRMGVVRKQDPAKNDGMVLCFTSDHGPKDFLTALNSFGQTGDLHDLGDVRYVHVESRAMNNPKTKTTTTRTSVQTMWTDGSFNLRTLMGPENQDSVGSDFASLPRPINSIRRFSAEAVGTPYSARVYESSSSAEVALNDYNTRMLSDNWAIIQSPVAEYPQGKDGRWYTRFETGEQVAVSADEPGSGHSMIVVAAMGVLDKAPVRSQGSP
jgi:hypothetical protein